MDNLLNGYGADLDRNLAALKSARETGTHELILSLLKQRAAFLAAETAWVEFLRQAYGLTPTELKSPARSVL